MHVHKVTQTSTHAHAFPNVTIPDSQNRQHEHRSQPGGDPLDHLLLHSAVPGGAARAFLGRADESLRHRASGIWEAGVSFVHQNAKVPLIYSYIYIYINIIYDTLLCCLHVRILLASFFLSVLHAHDTRMDIPNAHWRKTDRNMITNTLCYID